MHAPQQPPMAASRPPQESHANQITATKGFPQGLIQAISHYINTIPLRIWVIDNSASMQVADGHKIVGSTFQNFTTTDCSRWDEAQEEVAFHAYMSGCLGVPTRFNLVNTPVSKSGVQLNRSFSIFENGPARVQQDLQTAGNVMGQILPIGPATPLAYHIRQIQAMVSQMAPKLVSEGKAVSVILATSGVPTDNHGNHGPAVVQDFVQALRSLEGLPILIVVRLCTDDETVVDFYNTLDAMSTNLSYDVVDDFFGEAIEVYLKNPWLNYGMPLHRFRQFGFNIPVFDEIDERALSFPELRQFCAFFFPMQQPWPDPAAQWPSFLRALAMVLAREKMHFNPVTKSLGPWIDLRRLHFVYARNTPFPPDIQVPLAFQQRPHQQPFQGYPPQQQSARSQPQQPGSFQQPRQQQPMPQQQHAPPPPQQQQQQPPPPQSSAPPGAAVSASKYTQASGDEGMAQIKRGILQWATAPPAHQNLRSIDQLLSCFPQTFPPAFGLTDHAYFKKWKSFSPDALSGRDEAVLKRAVRKTKFFLHPDKLPKDLTKEQTFLCKMLWDIVADSWEAFGPSS
ncbi:expressed unknown protein [Seminavis robusta]|uniref:VWFA domain-containing protein n=1 Tax=Seminavis robusta TaxID=568900 RepID=A0A9N8EB65_9STRA|nr:expressed unknown protein [Seminavis robusta]|eukprot:Sro869_g213460.1 n/a (567) ;mRNA; r:14950-16749